MKAERKSMVGVAQVCAAALLEASLLWCCAAAGAAEEATEPQRIVASVRQVVLNARPGAEPSAEAAAALKAARRAMLEYTRREGAAGRLERVGWQLPFRTCYEWALRHELLRHAEAQAAVREALEALRAVGEQNAAVVAAAASRVAMQYADKWMDFNAAECVRLVDETESWVLGRPGGRKEWVSAFRYTQAGFLYQERQFKEGQEREWLWQSRQERLRAYVEGAELGLGLKTGVVWIWAEALYYMGRGKEALALMRDWDERHGAEVRDAQWLYWALRLELFECGDWAAAGRVLERANRLKAQWQRKPSQQRAYEALAEMYYENIGLLDYQLLRWREQEKKKPVRRLDLALGMSGGNN